MIDWIQNNPRKVACIALLTGVIVLAPYFSIFNSGFSDKSSNWGDFGSYLGGTLGVAFAALSFFALLYTVVMQRGEIEQQKELIQIQRFESTFFSLLDKHNQNLGRLNDLSGTINNIFGEGYSYQQNLSFTTFRFSSEKSSKASHPNLDQPYTFKESAENAQILILNDLDLSLYFRELYQLLKFVAKNNIGNVNKKFSPTYLQNSEIFEENEKMYVSLLRSNIPVEIFPLLAINCMYQYSSLNNIKNYWSLLERYEFLEHSRFDRLPVNMLSASILNSYTNALGKNTTFQNTARIFFENYSDNHGYKVMDELVEGNYLEKENINPGDSH